MKGGTFARAIEVGFTEEQATFFSHFSIDLKNETVQDVREELDKIFGNNIFNEKSVDTVDNAKVVEVTIADGVTAKRLASQLYEKGLISDEKIFYFQVKLSDYKDKFKAGTYSLNTGMKPTDMMKILAGISTTDTGDSE